VANRQTFLDDLRGKLVHIQLVTRGEDGAALTVEGTLIDWEGGCLFVQSQTLGTMMVLWAGVAFLHAAQPPTGTT
jgi:hypothetical protein